MVRVRPGKLPANVIVAPNSPSARAQQSTIPATRPGSTNGNVTRRKVTHRLAPSVAAEHRRVGVLFQDYRLFPHLSALDNVAFGLRCRGASKAQARRVARHWLDTVGLGTSAPVRPGALSGGPVPP